MCHLSFEKGDKFAIAFKRSDSEHPNQKAWSFIK